MSLRQYVIKPTTELADRRPHGAPESSTVILGGGSLVRLVTLVTLTRLNGCFCTYVVFSFPGKSGFEPGPQGGWITFYSTPLLAATPDKHRPLCTTLQLWCIKTEVIAILEVIVHCCPIYSPSTHNT